MSYTPPLGDALAFADSGDAYTPPLGDALAFFDGVDEDDGTRNLDIEVTVDVAVDVRVGRGRYADIEVDIPIVAAFGAFLDWTTTIDPLLVQDFYILTIAAPEMTDIDVPISSWQATANEGEAASFVQAVVPAALDVLDALEARQTVGELVIKMGYRYPGRPERMDEIIRAPFASLDYQQGPRNATATLSGYAHLGVSDGSATRALKEVRTFSSSNGKRRVTCALDMFLRPGMTVTTGDESFVVSYINYYVNRTGRFCQVGE